jgi:osmoprotectant transport system substrate-binding protein
MKWAVIAPAAILLALTGCGSGGKHAARTATLPGKGKPPVTIATKNFTEEYVLGELYAQALRAKGFTVVLKQNVGSSEIVDRALATGVIDAYPEYIGVIAQELPKRAPSQRPRTVGETYRRAKAYEERRGFTVLDRTPGFDADANVVKPSLARKFHLRSNTDLMKLGRFRYGAPPENETRFQGTLGLRQVYGLRQLVFVALPIDKRYPALDSGRVDAIAAFTTEVQLLQKMKYFVLSDPKNIFGFQNIVPVVSKKVLSEQGPAFRRTLNAVSAKLTNSALQRMNGAVDVSKQKPADVARRFLLQNGLL